MDARRWAPVVGLAFGTALGFAGAFGGFGTFVLVLVIGLIGMAVGFAVSGDLDVGELVSSVGGRRERP
ncbi:hypothetical protein [Actinomadura sp. 21ATH]|uniref:hypothetical protein n=1 Tax=Actinomadura sp. 21ATH TaxID=1735444 RepID=UPI0035C08F38